MTLIDLTKAEKQQTIKGFGTSACWWSQNVADNKTANELAELLYSKNGLGLNIYRYNIGAGWDKDNCRVENPWRRCESFYINDDSNEDENYHGSGYDFSRDKNAYSFMKTCLAKGVIDTVILFANSPHYSFTSSGQASGSLMHHTCNLPQSNFEKFADYFLDITEHFIHDGVPVQFISPINEPQWKWGGHNVWQEGCHYSPEEVRDVFHIFAEKIEKRKLNIKLYGPESGEIEGLTNKYLELFLEDKLIMKHLGAFAVHSYHADNDIETRNRFKENTLQKLGDCRFDMSEWCELPCKNHTKSIKGALITARIIGWDLINLGAESWTSWVAVNQYADGKGDGRDYSDGLLSASNGFTSYTVNKRYYGFLHFSKFIPVGSAALKINFTAYDGLNAFAFKTPDGKEIIIFTNEGNAKDIKIKSSKKLEEIYCTTEKMNMKQAYSGQILPELHIKAKSITTVILWK